LYRCGWRDLRKSRRGLWCSLESRRSEELEGGIIRVAVITMVGTAPALIFVLAAAAAVDVAHAQRSGDVEALPERLLDGSVLGAVEEGSRGEEELVGASKNGGWGEGG
jgi:hypothetical protein